MSDFAISSATNPISFLMCLIIYLCFCRHGSSVFQNIWWFDGSNFSVCADIFSYVSFYVLLREDSANFAAAYFIADVSIFTASTYFTAVFL